LPPVWPVEANLVFVRLPRALHARLQAAGANYYVRENKGIGVGTEEVLVRLVTSFSTQAQDVERFVALCRGA